MQVRFFGMGLTLAAGFSVSKTPELQYMLVYSRHPVFEARKLLDRMLAKRH